MKNYDAYSPKFFRVNLDEVKPLKQKYISRSNKDFVAGYFRKKGIIIFDYTVYEIPKHLKRNEMDQAKLLVIETANELLAKRFNNSQHLVVL